MVKTLWRWWTAKSGQYDAAALSVDNELLQRENKSLRERIDGLEHQLTLAQFGKEAQELRADGLTKAFVANEAMFDRLVETHGKLSAQR